MRGRRDRVAQPMWHTTYPRSVASGYGHAVRVLLRVIAIAVVTLVARIALVRRWPVRPVISR